YGHLLAYLLPGALLYSASHLLLVSATPSVATAYLGTTLLGYLLLLAGCTRCSRLLRQRLSTDIFNRHNQSFPQEERLLENRYSVNLPARYTLQGRVRRSWINIINPFRALLVIGTPGAGKSYFVIRH